MEQFEWELKTGFLSDATDLMSQMDECLNLHDGGDQLSEADLNLIFRLVHTLKGNSNACGMEPLGKVAHHFEDALILVRQDKAPNNKALLDLSHAFCDTINDALSFYRKDLNGIFQFDQLEDMVKSFFTLAEEGHELEEERPHQILIIDDDMDFANYIALFIKKEFKLECDFAANGEVGFHKAMERDYQCIVCDYEMPEMKGTDFVEKLRSTNGPNQHTMILFTSAYSRLQFFPSNTGYIEDVVFINKPVHLPRFVYYLKFGIKKNRGF